MELRAGSRLKSAVCETQVIVVRAPKAEVDLWCGGHLMVAIDAAPPPAQEIAPDHSGGTLMGKRYVDAEQTFEVLCTKGGAGSLSVGAEPLVPKEAKPLPASD
jgi:hypothetical protein